MLVSNFNLLNTNNTNFNHSRPHIKNNCQTTFPSARGFFKEEHLFWEEHLFFYPYVENLTLKNKLIAQIKVQLSLCAYQPRVVPYV